MLCWGGIVCAVVEATGKDAVVEFFCERTIPFEAGEGDDSGGAETP